MDPTLQAVIVGGLIALAGGVVGSLISHWLELRRDATLRQRDKEESRERLAAFLEGLRLYMGEDETPTFFEVSQALNMTPGDVLNRLLELKNAGRLPWLGVTDEGSVRRLPSTDTSGGPGASDAN